MPSKSKSQAKFMVEPYTYLIGWTDLDRWYYGVQYGKSSHPSNLLTSYFTSSEVVKQFLVEHGDPDVVQVRKTFSDSKKARQYEHTILRRMCVKSSDRWLNQTDNISFSIESCRKGSTVAKSNHNGKVGFLRDEFDVKRSEWASNAAKHLHEIHPGGVLTEKKTQAGKTTGNINVLTQRGWFARTPEQHSVDSKRAGNTNKERQTGICNPIYAHKRSEWSSAAGKRHKGKYWIFKDGSKKLVCEAELYKYVTNGWISPRLEKEQHNALKDS